MCSFLQCTRYHGHRHRVRSFGRTRSPFHVLVVLDVTGIVLVVSNFTRCTGCYGYRARSFKRPSSTRLRFLS